MTLDLFAVMHVSDFAAGERWWGALLGQEPSFRPHGTECVFELAEHRHIAVDEDPDRAGGTVIVVFGEDLDERVAGISERGIEPDERETYSNGVRKVIYRDADGNEIGFGGPPAE